MQQFLVGTTKHVIELGANFQVLRQTKSGQKRIVGGLENVNWITTGTIDVDDGGRWLRFGVQVVSVSVKFDIKKKNMSTSYNLRRRFNIGNL